MSGNLFNDPRIIIENVVDSDISHRRTQWNKIKEPDEESKNQLELLDESRKPEETWCHSDFREKLKTDYYYY